MRHPDIPPYMDGYDTKVTILDNGLTVATEAVVGARSAHMLVKTTTGCALIPEGKRSVSHILEHILAGQDNDERGVSYLKRYCLNNGYKTPNASDGGYINTYGLGNFDRPRPQQVRPEHALDYMERLLKELMDPGFDQKAFGDEVKAIDDELKNDLRYNGYAREAFFEMMLKAQGEEASWLGRRSHYDLANLHKITLDDVIGYHRQHYGPNRAYVILTGAVNHDEAVSRFARLTEKWKPVDPLERKPLSYQPAEYRFHDIRPSVGRHKAEIELYFPMLRDAPYTYADFVNNYQAHAIIGGNINSVLREQRNLVYGAGVGGKREDYAPLAGSLDVGFDVRRLGAVNEGIAFCLGDIRENADRFVGYARAGMEAEIAMAEPGAGGRAETLAYHLIQFGYPRDFTEYTRIRKAFDGDALRKIVDDLFSRNPSLRVTADWRYMDRIPDVGAYQKLVSSVVPSRETPVSVVQGDNLSGLRRAVVRGLQAAHHVRDRVRPSRAGTPAPG